MRTRVVKDEDEDVGGISVAAESMCVYVCSLQQIPQQQALVMLFVITARCCNICQVCKFQFNCLTECNISIGKALQQSRAYPATTATKTSEFYTHIMMAACIQISN